VREVRSQASVGVVRCYRMSVPVEVLSSAVCAPLRIAELG